MNKNTLKEKIIQFTVVYGLILFWFFGYLIMPIIDKALESDMQKFNTWANEKTENLPNSTEMYIHWNLPETDSTVVWPKN